MFVTPSAVRCDSPVCDMLEPHHIAGRKQVSGFNLASSYRKITRKVRDHSRGYIPDGKYYPPCLRRVSTPGVLFEICRVAWPGPGVSYECTVLIVSVLDEQGRRQGSRRASIAHRSDSIGTIGIRASALVQTSVRATTLGFTLGRHAMLSKYICATIGNVCTEHPPASLASAGQAGSVLAFCA